MVELATTHPDSDTSIICPKVLIAQRRARDDTELLSKAAHANGNTFAWLTTPVTTPHRQRGCMSSADPCIAALNREWSRLCTQAAPTHWRVDAGTLAEVLAAIPERPDEVLGTLLRRRSQGDELAGRVVLQAMLGKLVLLAAHDPHHCAADYVTECWVQLCRYPLARRPRRIAANLALDTRRALWSVAAPPLLIDPAVLDELAPPAVTDTVAMIRAATRLGLIDRPAGACLVAVYCLGLRSHEAAAKLAISPELVRWRNARSIRRLAPHAATLAAVA